MDAIVPAPPPSGVFWLGEPDEADADDDDAVVDVDAGLPVDLGFELVEFVVNFFPSNIDQFKIFPFTNL